MEISNMQTILVTGGLGFIGSHTCVELLLRDYNVIVIDNLSNSKPDVFDKIKQIVNDHGNITFYKGDLLNISDIKSIFICHDIHAVIHFAGLKAVNESIAKPLNYYYSNIVMTLNLLNVMVEHNCKNIIFSSSATVYGNKESPLKESVQTGQEITNPYGKTKYFIENILQDLWQADQTWSIVILRYFNPVGAHESGLIGEDPNDIPNNLMPYVLNVSVGKSPVLNIYGNDYDTIDGTCVRDFIHIVDLAKGHLASTKKLNETGIHIYNLGTGTGTSVLELITAFKKINNMPNYPYKFTDRRTGDISICFANVDKVRNELGWTAKKSIEDACYDAFKFASINI